MNLNKLKIGIATLAAATMFFGLAPKANAIELNDQPPQISQQEQEEIEAKIEREMKKLEKKLGIVKENTGQQKEKPKIEIIKELEGSIWAESRYDGKNVFFNTTLQQGINILKYKDYKLEPFLELDLKIDKERYPWNNTIEINPGIRLKHGIWQLGIKEVNGYYHGHAKMEGIGSTNWNMPKKYRDGYHELQPYFSLWHGWEKQVIKSPDSKKYPLTFVGEEWAKMLYHGPGSEGLNKNNLVVQGTAEAGIIVAKYEDNLVEPFYQIGLSADTKGLPWDNMISNSIGIKLKNPKQGWQIGIKGFIDKYYGNADMTNIGGQGWNMPRGDRKGNSGVMLFFTLWKGW